MYDEVSWEMRGRSRKEGKKVLGVTCGEGGRNGSTRRVQPLHCPRAGNSDVTVGSSGQDGKRWLSNLEKRGKAMSTAEDFRTGRGRFVSREYCSKLHAGEHCDKVRHAV